MEVYRKNLINAESFEIDDEIVFNYRGTFYSAVAYKLTDNGAFFMMCSSIYDNMTFKDFIFEDLPDDLKIRIIPFSDGEYFHKGYINNIDNFESANNIEDLINIIESRLVVFQVRNY